MQISVPQTGGYGLPAYSPVRSFIIRDCGVPLSGEYLPQRGQWFCCRVIGYEVLDSSLLQAKGVQQGSYIEIVTDRYEARELMTKRHQSFSALYSA